MVNAITCPPKKNLNNRIVRSNITLNQLQLIDLHSVKMDDSKEVQLEFTKQALVFPLCTWKLQSILWKWTLSRSPYYSSQLLGICQNNKGQTFLWLKKVSLILARKYHTDNFIEWQSNNADELLLNGQSSIIKESLSKNFTFKSLCCSRCMVFVWMEFQSKFSVSLL